MGSESLLRVFQLDAIAQTFNKAACNSISSIQHSFFVNSKGQVRILSQTSAVLTTYLMACLPLFITLFKIFPYKPCLSEHKSMNNDLIVLKCLK